MTPRKPPTRPTRPGRKSPKRAAPASAPVPLLDAVHIAGDQAAPGPGTRLHLPRDLPPDQAQEAIQREALRWTYMLRSRKRWVSDLRARERNELEARDALRQIGLAPQTLGDLADNELLVVRVPWNGREAEHWASRIFPWEYVLSAATRQARLMRSVDGHPRQLTVMRELQRQQPSARQPDRLEPALAQAPTPGPAPCVLFLECVPSELAGAWSALGERQRLARVLPARTKWIVLRHPTPAELLAALREHKPSLLHVAGLDTHQGLRELRLHFGAGAEVDVALGRRWLRDLGGTVDDAADLVDARTPLSRLAASAPAPSPQGETLLRVDDIVADTRLLLDGVLLRNEAGLPLMVRAHDLARLLKLAPQPMWLAGFNLWNSAARLAPLLVAEGAAQAAMGFQDAFDESLADFVYSTLYRLLQQRGWNLPRAFIDTWAQVRQLPESVDATGITLWSGVPVLPLAGVHTEDRKPPKRTAPPRCLVKPFRELNYAVLHNAQPLFEQFVLECDEPHPTRTADVEVEVHMGSEKASFRRRVKLDRARVALTRDVHVPLTAEVARTVSEAISSSLSVHVQEGAKVLYHDTHRLRLLPVDQWRDNRRDGRWLPSFVQPRDPAVLRAIEQAQRYNRVLRDDPNAGFEGYQAAMPDDEESLRGVDRQVEALWATLLHDWRLGYVNPPPAYSGALDSQRLRTPSMILAQRCGTCIDLALLFASCLELIDIHPVIFLLEGHALPGWWRHPSFRDEYASMSDGRLAEVVTVDVSENGAASAQAVAWHTGKASHAEIQRWIRQRKLVPIETVRLTENCGFIEAIEAGVAALAPRSDFDSMLEIVTARQELVTPLPLLKEAS